MTDTQWPRFVVFHQEKAHSPHEYAGSVHAPDAEMALLNARDVFVRRPACVSLWIVPATAIFSKTAEELNSSWLEGILNSDQPEEPYCVFEKRLQKGANAYVGEVAVATAELALKRALESNADRSALVWWVFPKRAITHSTAEDIEVLFAPATMKDYRDQGQFHTEATMQKIKSHTHES